MNQTDALLRNALRANAAFSTVCGLVMVFASGPLSESLGITPPWLLLATGIVLLGFAISLVGLVRSQTISRSSVLTVVALDLGWVVGSVPLLALPLLPLTSAGWWAVAIVADIVLVLAVLQFVGLRKLVPQVA